MTQHQQALADALDAILSVAGQPATFNSHPFTAAFANLKPVQRVSLGFLDNQIVLVARTTALPNPAPTKGDHIMVAGIDYRIAKSNTSLAADKTLFALSA